MTLKQKVLDYLRTHAEPFTLKMLAEATGGKEHSCRGYLSAFMADGLVAFAEPKTHDGKPTAEAPWGRFKPRKYKAGKSK